MTDALLVLACFLAGSIPTAYLLGRWLKGVDIRTLGSGNVGATNVFRTMGKGPGFATLFIDILKGFLPVLLLLRVHPEGHIPLAGGLAAIAGHSWTPFLGFKGGKGVATSAGVFLALVPWAALAAVAGFLAGFLSTRHVSVGSLLACAVLPTASFWIYGPTAVSCLSGAIAFVVILKHVPNIRRLIRGEEHAFGRKP